jgi:hypothetical protein
MRALNILKAATEKGFEINENEAFYKVVEEAENYLLEQDPDERHECEVKSLGRHGQRVDFGSFWQQGEIVDFRLHWNKEPNTEVNHSDFIDEDGKYIQLFYLVGETDYNAPEGYYFDRKQGKHVKNED